MGSGPRRRLTWTVARRATASGFLLLLFVAAWLGIPILEGSTSASRLLGLVPFVDPLAAVEAGLAARQVTETMLVGAGILVALAVLLGPVFCGWLCPLGLLLDLNQAGAGAVRRRRRRPPRSGLVSAPAGTRYAVLGLFVGLAVVARIPLFQGFSPINLFVRGVVHGAAMGLGVVLLIVVVEWFVPRLWCRALCPLGAFYALLGRFARLRIRVDPELVRRSACGLCASDCPMGIPVMERHVDKPSVDDPSCTRCGSCVDACPRGMLRLGFFTRGR